MADEGEELRRRMRVYVAGPYTEGDREENVRNAVNAAARIADAGHYPFVPHLSFLWQFHAPRPYEWWMDWSLEWLCRCEVFVRLDGYSPGANVEEEIARDLKIPIYHSVEEFLDAD